MQLAYLCDVKIFMQIVRLITHRFILLYFVRQKTVQQQKFPRAHNLFAALIHCILQRVKQTVVFRGSVWATSFFCTTSIQPPSLIPTQCLSALRECHFHKKKNPPLFLPAAVANGSFFQSVKDNPFDKFKRKLLQRGVG